MPRLAYRPTLPRPDDQSLIDDLCLAISRGEPMSSASYAAGISERTANDWLHQGLQELANASPDTPLEQLGSHARFALSVKEAEAKFVRENLGYVRRDREVAGKGWLPAMTLLERRMPQHFGRRDRLEVDQRSVSLTISTQVPPSVLAELGRLLIEEAGQGSAAEASAATEALTLPPHSAPQQPAP